MTPTTRIKSEDRPVSPDVGHHPAQEASPPATPPLIDAITPQHTPNVVPLTRARRIRKASP